MNLKIVLKRLLGPFDIIKALNSSIYKLRNIIVVDKDKNLIFAIFNIMPPSHKSFIVKQKFLLISFILSFHKN